MRKYITADRIFSYIAKKGKNLYQADQDVINALFKDKIISVNPCFYNLDEATYRRNDSNLQWVRQSCVFVHYNVKNKPWKKNYKGAPGVFWPQEQERKAKSRTCHAEVSCTKR